MSAFFFFFVSCVLFTVTCIHVLYIFGPHACSLFVSVFMLSIYTVMIRFSSQGANLLLAANG